MSETVEQAISALQQGGVIAYPTEAVFGLGCDPDNESALQKLLDLKQRPAHKGLILIAADLTQLLPYIEALPDEQLAKIESRWPGPVTWLIPKSSRVSSLLSGEHQSIAVRVTAHPVAAELCRSYGKPIVSTSANLAGKEPARSSEQVRTQFSERIDCVVDGPVDLTASPSEIRDLVSNRIIRDSK